MKKAYLFLGIPAAALLLFGATVIGFQDWQTRLTPGNPASGFFRTWADAAANKFRCQTSAGAACYFDSGIVAGGSAIWSGAAGPNGADFAPHNMTGDAAPSPYVVSVAGGCCPEWVTPAWKAFDGLTSTGWQPDANNPAVSFKLDLGVSGAAALASYSIMENTTAISGWTLQGSNNNSTWTTIDTESGISWSTPQTRNFVASTGGTTYRYYQVAIPGGPNGGPWLSEVYLYAPGFSSGVAGDFYFATATGQWYGPRPAGGSPSWPSVTTSDAVLALTDILTNNVSTSAHGFAPKLPNDATRFLNGVGAYSAPLGSVFDVPCSNVGKPGAGATVLLLTFTRAVTFAGNFAGSYGTDAANPTATATYTVSKNGSPIGTAVVSTGGVVTFTTTSGASQSFAAGDRMTITAPGSQDATLSDVAFTLAATR